MADDFDLRVISLGAGVQSSAMYLMAVDGILGPRPDVAIFADTQAEPKAVMAQLAYLNEYGGATVPIHVVTAGDLGEQFFTGGIPRSLGRTLPTMPPAIPFHTRNRDGSKGMLQRQCTKRAKLEPIHREVRRMLGLVPGQRVAGQYRVEMWIGISSDEVGRMKPSQESWIEKRHPFVLERPMSRGQILEWMLVAKHPRPARSACYFCPYRSDAEWVQLKADPLEWHRVVTYDRRLRTDDKYRIPNATGKLTGDFYLHASLRPIADVDFEHDGQLYLWDSECEGMCGV